MDTSRKLLLLTIVPKIFKDSSRRLVVLELFTDMLSLIAKLLTTSSKSGWFVGWLVETAKIMLVTKLFSLGFQRLLKLWMQIDNFEIWKQKLKIVYWNYIQDAMRRQISKSLFKTFSTTTFVYSHCLALHHHFVNALHQSQTSFIRPFFPISKANVILLTRQGMCDYWSDPSRGWTSCEGPQSLFPFRCFTSSSSTLFSAVKDLAGSRRCSSH